ncbi:PTS glucose transporter subunit IIA [Providencia rettgeri]|nr:PTS glucose transporter subunit IIA [Providencia rettgeri]
MFAEKIVVGDGIAIKPAGKIVAPVGTVQLVKYLKLTMRFLESDDGIKELFVHFGIDTVELKGELKRIAEEGQTVKKGDLIIEFGAVRRESKICSNASCHF